MEGRKVVETQGSHKSHVALPDLRLPDEASKNGTLFPSFLRYGRQNFRGQQGGGGMWREATL